MLVVKSSIGKIKQIKNVESEKDKGNKGRDLAQWERCGNVDPSGEEAIGGDIGRVCLA